MSEHVSKKRSWLGSWLDWIKEVGFRGVMAEVFNLNNNHHPMYRIGYESGCEMDLDDAQAVLLALARDPSYHEPFRNRWLCQMRGMSDALREREKKQ